jgi:hypothetical protein
MQGVTTLLLLTIAAVLYTLGHVLERATRDTRASSWRSAGRAARREPGPQSEPALRKSA